MHVRIRLPTCVGVLAKTARKLPAVVDELEGRVDVGAAALTPARPARVSGKGRETDRLPRHSNNRHYAQRGEGEERCCRFQSQPRTITRPCVRGTLVCVMARRRAARGGAPGRDRCCHDRGCERSATVHTRERNCARRCHGLPFIHGPQPHRMGPSSPMSTTGTASSSGPSSASGCARRHVRPEFGLHHRGRGAPG